MLIRTRYLERLHVAVNRSPVTALLGPRQAGKTTLARQFAAGTTATFFDLESQVDLQRLQNPELVLGSQQGLVIIDEIQTLPELFGVLRVLADRPSNPARFLVLGSASPTIVKAAAESLAGRVEFVELTGFDLIETGADRWESLWVRGGFPRAFLAASDADSVAWREGFMRTFLERDLPALGIRIPAPAMRRFWVMLAHYHGQVWNASELARALGLSDKTVRSYLDILTGAFMTRQLQPWYANIAKRQVKSPKIYLRDSGLLHNLLALPDLHSLLGYPRIGASWEGFVIEQVVTLGGLTEGYFWATQSGAELDLLFFRRGRAYGIEVKFNEAPVVTRSMRVALEDLELAHLWVVHPGPHTYPADGKITMTSILDLDKVLAEAG